MKDRNDAGARERAGISTRTVEILVALILFTIGAIVVFDSYRLGSKWGSDGPESGYFPFYIGLIICFSSLVNAVQAATSKSVGGRQPFVTPDKFKLVLMVLVPAIIYVLAVQFIGIYIASALYIALFMKLLGNYAWFQSIAVGALVNVSFFFMFEVWFKVPLYKGTLDPLRFLGY
jgi:hypothetical protein